MKKAYNRVAIKIGSNVLTRKDGSLDVTRMSALVDQMAYLKKNGIEIVLVSSGAVAAGRSMMRNMVGRKMDAVDSRQLFSAVGQAKLINRYYELFREHGIHVGQVLTMKENFGTRRHYLNQRNCMSVMLENNVLPIVNENDTVSVTELMFTDNDELSGLVATMMDVQALIILTNVDGIYDGFPGEPGVKVIREVLPDRNLDQYISTERSSFGRGGMMTKCGVARKVADEGIEVIIANGRREQILVDILLDDSDVICTRFVPGSSSVSSVKKWIAHSSGFAKGRIYLDDNAVRALSGNKAVSLLPVGVTRIEGDFEKDDLVKILDTHGNEIGVGKAAYDSDEARAVLGQHDQKPVIHYDYLYLE